ncbi:glycosyltransferase [Aeromonas veronii]|uniref:glycosyltransferase n=1 Tax=Aeromonas veronii TaxID=654 RepID=UPI003BA311BB
MSIISSIFSKNKNFKGFIDDISNGTITGWACTKNNKALEVLLYINGDYYCSLVPNLYRDDLERANIGTGRYGFSVEMPKEIAALPEISVKMVAVQRGKKVEIHNKKILLNNDNPVNSKKKGSLGNIDRFVANTVHGWLGSSDQDVFPYLTANGKPCLIELTGIQRSDVEQQHGFVNAGFVAKVPQCGHGNIKFELHSISMKGIDHIDTKLIRGGVLVPDSISAVFEAVKIAKQKDSVGIVVWEGTHNPIGRAQVLYNILKGKRPTLIISFNIGFSEQPVWQPLLNSDCKVLMLPWKDRELYKSLFKELDLNFDLVWICKPRYPAFVLAEYISHPNTRYIMDLDDNELEMSSSKAAKEKPYGLLSAKMAQRYIDRLPIRSVASKTLQDDFGGQLVRHARAKQPVKRVRVCDLTQEVRVGFIGTVRPHKGVVEAAKAIKSLNDRKGYNIKFVVGGIYDPMSIRSELISLGCEVHNEIDSSRLSYHLQNLDVIITGFPDDAANKEIIRYQISSKIGDGLSNERPVLVPEGLSVADLDSVPGVYLFNSLNFERVLIGAITDKSSISLDKQFSLHWNYEQFNKLADAAMNDSPSGEQLFGVKSAKQLPAYNNNVVLVWKQHDTGLYGRRVDHIARLLAANGMKVTCLEIMAQEQFKRYEKESARVDADFRFIVEDYKKKRDGYNHNGIFYKTISLDHTQSTEQALKLYLIEQKIYPDNSKVILFPAVPDWKTVTKVFSGYPIICDVVDNQLGWEKKQPLELLQQYKYLMDVSRCVIFNSEENKSFFEKMGFLENLNARVIPNWYSLPLDYQPKSRKIDKEKEIIDIVYSGNMNDRFDWDTVSRIPKEIDRSIRVHLIGNCQRALDKMSLVLDDPAIIYHGPMRERELLEFMEGCDLAIMPHIHDEHSGFMNPMKVNMYSALGIPSLATTMPGVDFNQDGLTQAVSSDDFVEKLNTLVSRNDHNFSMKPSDKKCTSLDYLELVSSFVH